MFWKHNSNLSLRNHSERKENEGKIYKGQNVSLQSIRTVETVQSFTAVCLFFFFFLAVCEALLLQQKPGILNPRGSQWEGKAS